MMVQFTKRQWLTLIVISIADFANAICVSLQAPFYPQEVSEMTVGNRGNFYFRSSGTCENTNVDHCSLVLFVNNLLGRHF